MKTILRPSGDQYFLKDAIRDLVVVIVGILAALYLESWWQDRQDRAEEALLLEGLRAEFVANKEQLVEKMSAWSYANKSANRARQFMGMSADELEATEVTRAFKGAGYYPFFDPRTGQLSSLISSGKLGLIQKAKLRAMIADWPSLVEDLGVEREIALEMVTTGYYFRLREYLSDDENSPFKNRIAELLSDKMIYGDLGGARSNTDRSLREGETILQATDEIIAMIDAELENSQ